MIGQVFNSVTVISDANKRHGSRAIIWRCLCICGRYVNATAYDLRSGRTKSCGCLKSERMRKMATTHGMSKSPEYKIWSEIIKRTENRNYKDFDLYGGRGISMSLEWRQDFMSFYRDMGPRPSGIHSIDRINNDGNYEKNNCRWVLIDIQNRNKRNNIWIEKDGELKILEDWAKSLGVTRSVFKTILKKDNNYKIK